MYKQQHYLLPEIFDDYFTQNHKIHKHNTRQSDVLHIKQTSNQNGKKTPQNMLKYSMSTNKIANYLGSKENIGDHV